MRKEARLDKSLEGKTGEPFTMAVELGKIREFARATKSRNPAYDGHPGDTPLSPTTFLTTARFWQTPASSALDGAGLNWERILHGEQEFVFHGPPPRADDVLTGVSRVERVYEKTGKRGGTMTFVEEVVEFKDQSGRLVAESRSTAIETSKATTEGGA
jgi:hypothetical protein